MSTSTRRGGRGGSVVEFAPATAEYQLTELKNVSTSRGSANNSVDFTVRLVNAVRDHPCFYDQNDIHFGNRHADAKFKAGIWEQVASTIGSNDHVNVLAQQWRRLKERYIKEKTKGLSAGEVPLDEVVAGEMEWLDEFVLEAIPAPSSSAVADVSVSDAQQLYFMEGEEEDMLGDNFVDDHEEYHVEEEENRLEEDEQQHGSRSPAGSAHSGTGSDIDVGGVGGSQSAVPIILGPKDMPGTSGGHGLSISRASSLHGRQPVTSGAPTNYRYVSSSSHQQHPAEGITVTSRGNGTLIAHPKREGSVGGGSTLTMVIDPTTYYQNGTQKMYRLVNVADLDQSQQQHLHHLRPVSGGGMGGSGGGTTLIAEPTGGGLGYSIGRGTRKRMGPPLSPPSHAGSSGMLGGPSSSADLASPYGKASGQLGDDLILDDGIVGETIVIDHQRDDDSPLLVDSPGMHHHHHLMMPSSQRSMHHRGQALQLSPTLLGNGSGARSSGGYSPGFSNQGQPNPFATSQYDADLALQHFISQHLSKMNDDDKALAKMNIQRILLDARFGTGTTLRVCMGEEDAELTDAAVASEMVTGE